MDQKTFLFASVAIAVVLSGCAAPTHRTEYTSTPTAVENPIEFIEASIVPNCRRYDCESLTLTVKNKSSKAIEVNWNKTIFLANGQSSGGFIFDGVYLSDVNAPKAPDVVLSKGELKKMVWPAKLAKYTSGKYGGWSHRDIPMGSVGIYLTITADGKDYSQVMTTNLKIENVSIKN